jgi:PTS system mannose-specific IID component
VAAIAGLSLPVIADRLRLGGAALCGLSAAVVAARADLLMRASAVLVAVSVAGVGYLALARGARLLPSVYAAILAGAGAALVAGRFHGSL